MRRVQSAELDWAAADTADTGHTDIRTYAGVTTVELQTKDREDFTITKKALTRAFTYESFHI